MYCKKCGAELGDGSFCENCGAPASTPTSPPGEKPKRVFDPVKANTPMVSSNNAFGLIALFASLASILFANLGTAPALVALILSIAGIVIAKRKFLKKGLPIIAVIISSFSLLCALALSVNNPSEEATALSSATASVADASTKAPDPTSAPTLCPTPEPTAEPTPEPTPEPEERVSKEEFIASCEEIPYKSILRNPSDYEGQNITVTVRISQVMGPGFLSPGTWYHCYSDSSGHGWYLDDEYYIVDDRVDASLKLLDDDIIIVYGTAMGTTDVTRAIGWTKTEVVQISMQYCELIGE